MSAPKKLFPTRSERELSGDKRAPILEWRTAIVDRMRRQALDYTTFASVAFLTLLLEAGDSQLLERVAELAACPEDRDPRSNAAAVRELRALKLIGIGGYGRSERGANGLRVRWTLSSREDALAWMRSHGWGWLLAELGIGSELAAAS